jgi:hypothetical protein
MKDRPKQELPEQIVAELLANIRHQFCGEMTDKAWGQSRRMFMRVVTFPAAQLNAQGVSLPPERYKAILLDILQDIKRHVAAAVSYWPGYLLSCLQKHWAMHGDEYYDEAKGIRTAVERAKLAYSGAQITPDPVDDTTEKLAAVHRVLSQRHHRPGGARKKPPQQSEMTLF